MSWAHYILQVNIYLVVFYGFYKLLLDKETYFILNRIYLVAAGALSLAIPFLRFEWFTTQPAAQTVYTGVDQLNMLVVAVAEPATEKLSLGNLIVIIYLIGIAVFSIRFILQLFSVRNLFRQAGKGTAFSFFSKKMVDEQLPGFETIHKHEEIHIRQLHSLDVVFFEILGIITWFNPVTYLYKKTVKNIHEFLADEEAAKFQGDKEEYAMLLLSTAFGVAPSTLTNNFYAKSLIKKRIYMLHKQRSAKTAILKYGLFVPLFAVTLLMSSATIRNNEKIQQVADEIPLDMVKETVEKTIIAPVTKAVGVSVPNAAKAKKIAAAHTSSADWSDFYRFIGKYVRYPLQAMQNSVEGNSQVKFSIRNGEIEGLGIIGKPIGTGCDAEVMSKLLAYKDYNTKPDGNYMFVVSFRLEPSKLPRDQGATLTLDGYTLLDKVVIMGYAPDDKGNAKPIPLNEVNIRTGTAPQNNDEKVYDFTTLEQHPTFQGGMDKFYKFLGENVRYPAYALEHKIQGKVFLSFIVEVDGSLSNIKVDRKLGGGTDEEAIRVLELSPKWIPGVQNGKIVRVKYNIPIGFSLSK
ncbi:M56 family metallopeptidase [Pedobacter sp. GR22-6]|uniref:M56 family metallopeptidase n=1 Tax=Pedobacter sp. GR22-6 TaxID=3127957 RepID=UPI00307E2E2F